ncbi:nuclear transport factor 2 family protein [Demequina sp. NBRC 110054]|uniref:YybH family protein n=1 Tax=Demequina sp. NBRC 110054 TaxID=1570343 RepID=UPI0013562D8A|nr:nuclear transport factor 2 family protein [Demequina sp. NBRC 110054]
MSHDETSPAAQITAAIRDMYDAYLAGDRERSNGHIAADVTLWDSVHEDLIRGRAGLDALRDARPDSESNTLVKAIEVTEPVIDVWGDIALARHTFEVVFHDTAEPTERVRNTAVWRRDDGRWRVIHNHEDVLPSITPQ